MSIERKITLQNSSVRGMKLYYEHTKESHTKTNKTVLRIIFTHSHIPLSSVLCWHQ